MCNRECKVYAISFSSYCSSRYDFPSQDSVIEFVVDVALKRLVKQPDTLIVCGTYTIGKEKIFLG